VNTLYKGHTEGGDLGTRLDQAKMLPKRLCLVHCRVSKRKVFFLKGNFLEGDKR